MTYGCDNTELININNTNSTRFLENDISNELPGKTSCKYYSVDEYQCLKKKRILTSSIVISTRGLICGEFNLDLLKIGTDHFTQYFFNLLCSYGLLPHILQPTRVTEHSATVIDNIFSNNIQDDIISGNILLTLSKHFSQFISVDRKKIDLKNMNIYQRDYSKFSNKSFRDVSIQTWNYAHENIHQAFKDFYTKLEGSVSKHCPLKEVVPQRN